MDLKDVTVDCSSVIDKLKNSIKVATKKVYSKKIFILNVLVTQEQSTLFTDLDFLTDELAEDDYKIQLEKTIDFTGIKENIFSTVTDLNNDERYGGIFIDKLDSVLEDYESIIYSMVHPTKDVSSLNVVNSGLLFYNQQLIFPPIVSTVIKLLESESIKLAGQHIVILNKSSYLGKPLSMALVQKDANVSLLDKRMKEFKKVCKNANIVISAINEPLSINMSMLKKDVIFIDIGDALSRTNNLIPDDNIVSKYFDSQDIYQIYLLFILYNFLRVIFFNNKDLFE